MIKKINNPSMTAHALTLVNVLADLASVLQKETPQRSIFVILLQVALTGRSRGGTFSQSCGSACASALRSQFGASVGAVGIKWE